LNFALNAIILRHFKKSVLTTMALIKQIRQRTGLAIGVIAGGLILFLLGGDLLSPNSSLLNTNQNSVGEIAGGRIQGFFSAAHRKGTF
jgi:hypothetical protein